MKIALATVMALFPMTAVAKPLPDHVVVTDEECYIVYSEGSTVPARIPVYTKGSDETLIPGLTFQVSAMETIHRPLAVRETETGTWELVTGGISAPCHAPAASSMIRIHIPVMSCLSSRCSRVLRAHHAGRDLGRREIERI